mgnify:CR=1 FL=1
MSSLSVSNSHITNELAVSIRGVGLTYTTSIDKKPTLKSRVKSLGRGTKQTRVVRALDDINLDVQYGHVLGVIGTNGAGKSSTMRIIGATSERTSGEVTILGKDPQQFGPQIRAHLGVVPQQDNLDEELTCAENLYIYGRYFGLPKITVKNKGKNINILACIGSGGVGFNFC